MHVSRMVRDTVALALLLLACVHAVPAPRLTEVTLIRDSILGYNYGAGDQQASGVLEGTRTVHIDLPDAAAEKAPELTLLENVNSGAGIALGARIDFSPIIAAKDSILAGKNPFWRKK